MKLIFLHFGAYLFWITKYNAFKNSSLSSANQLAVKNASYSPFPFFKTGHFLGYIFKFLVWVYFIEM